MASEYHGTYRGSQQLPNDGLWEEVCHLLLSDKTFSGCLEEEAMEQEVSIEGVSSILPTYMKTLTIKEVPAGKHKACDIHMRVNLASPIDAVKQIEGLEIASFDRPTPEGMQRVYTVTCETREDGRHLFDALSKYLARVPGLRGKMKLEMTTRFLRQPDNAATLPITLSSTIAKWISTSNP